MNAAMFIANVGFFAHLPNYYQEGQRAKAEQAELGLSTG
jgi:hypothetical protein